MPARDSLYFIAIIIPPDIAEEINVFKHDMAANYNSKAALRIMPHITLKAPFKLPAESHAQLLQWFGNIPLEISAFLVKLSTFGYFDNKYSKVIYVKPLISDGLIALQSIIANSFNKAYPQINMHAHERQFSPHITIAYRDLTNENFEKAWAGYKNREYSSSFMCTAFSLLQHNGIKWEVIEEKILDLKEHSS